MARKIIEANQLVVLATTNSDGQPWISPVVYAYDRNWNLYFVSIPSSRHSQNSRIHKNAACAIFDSHQVWGTGCGLQIEATIEELTFRGTLRAAKCYISRKYPYPNSDPKTVVGFVQEYLARKKIYKFYKIIPRVVWMNNPNSTIDVRVKIDLAG